MSRLTQTLQSNLTATLDRLGLSHPDHIRPQHDFTQFKKATHYIIDKFDGGAPPVPPLEKRRIAIRKLLQGTFLSPKDWSLVSYGLADPLSEGECLLQNQKVFKFIYTHFKNEVEAGVLKRKTWFGLVSSYFCFNHPNRIENPCWLALRTLIKSAFYQLKSSQSTTKKWIQVVQKHQAIFTENPSIHLAKIIFDGNLDELTEIKSILQISETSWLWEQMFFELSQYIQQIADSIFKNKIDTLIPLFSIYPQHADAILTIILNRYEKSSFKNVIHSKLKFISMDLWGSPQISLRRNVWLRHVNEDVIGMVLQWIAREDLEHFFKLLQGEIGADHRRMMYWLRFVEQMDFTYVILGNDAFHNRSKDYVEFREKNINRFGRLTGGSPSNNAFVMGIAGYFFVEFSGVGNACYVYRRDTVPFNMDGRVLNVVTDLKRMIDLNVSGVYGNKINHSKNWESRADELLLRLRIFPDSRKNNHLLY